MWSYMSHACRMLAYVSEFMWYIHHIVGGYSAHGIFDSLSFLLNSNGVVNNMDKTVHLFDLRHKKKVMRRPGDSTVWERHYCR